MASEHTVLFSAGTIAEKVTELAAHIDRDHGDDGVVVIVVLKGAGIFAADLVRAMETETEVAYLTASSYVDGFTPGESISLRGDLDLDVDGRDVLIVDDIIDTGRTLKELSALRGVPTRDRWRQCDGHPRERYELRVLHPVRS
jgi:hypoxanthine phosphoribosyltransferase